MFTVLEYYYGKYQVVGLLFIPKVNHMMLIWSKKFHKVLEKLPFRIHQMTILKFIQVKLNSSNEHNSDDILSTDNLDNILPSELSQLIQNFHKTDIETIITELVTLIIKITDEGKSHDQRTVLDDYLSSHDFTIEEIYEWL